ncbi:pyrophosphorylase [Leucobacter viscericola]|uniref:Pyrophosphorylase n=1 Tax=Leucobacter viscericola TaxID=2714935 RepID=A0A6G7XEZ6_9MICO|nr:pyrophosphorylase [Leucobacter viscericola]QIK62948.1 pyrophosphorylase [Leucobacter viscericola]
MSRVLSTQQAKDAINQVKAIITGGLQDEITKLDGQGKVLSDPNVWDGPLAIKFRGEVWPDTKTALDNVKTELDGLREQLDTIAQNIFTAGGAS